jgi:ATP-binding cassette, subfamily F, member 3
VYKDLNMVVERGERIALVGPNGAGKSTLLKLLVGVLEPQRGSVTLGHNIRREYFAQHQLEVFDPDLTVLQTMEESAGPLNKASQVRAYLGTFLFSGNDVDKKVGILSGGEKARLALARMLLDPAGLLLLDEPTNHLDMASRDVLTEALRQFEGSIVFISHDRHLINAIGTKVVEVVDGHLTHYLGDWEYYQWKKGRAAPPPAPPAESSALSPGVSGAVAGGSSVGAQAANASPSYQERKDVQRRHRRVEKRILQLEERQQQLARSLADPANASDYELLLSAGAEAELVRDELASLYEEWEALSEMVSALDS